MNNPILYLHADLNCGLGHRRRLETLQTAWDAPSEWFGTDIPSVAGICVVDDYCFTVQSFQELKANGHLVAYFTEFANDYPVDILINQNIGAEKLKYNAPIQLLGTRFFMLRQEYLTVQKYGHGAIFDADSVDRKLSPLEFGQTMAEAKAIICSAGITAYEALYLEKPLLLRMSAENQRRTYEGLIDNGYAIPYNDIAIERLSYGWIPTVKSGRNLVDGLGPSRVCQALRLMWEQTH
jgi:hypothetical protein